MAVTFQLDFSSARMMKLRSKVETARSSRFSVVGPCVSSINDSRPHNIRMSDRRKTLLIVDNDEVMRESLTGSLRRDLRVLRAGTGEGALQMMEKEDVDLMMLDARLPGISCFEVLKIVKENYPYVEVIVLTEVKEFDVAMEAMRLGAYHYTPKDYRPRVAAHAARQCRRASGSSARCRQAARGSRREQRTRVRRRPQSGHTRHHRDDARVAPRPVNVLVLGESGTGKELLARLIHREGGRADAAFVAVNLAAIPKELVESTLFGHEKGAFTGAIRQQLGKFELASGGTLFLDEVGDLRYDLQAKLLRAIQEEEIERVGGMHPIKTDLRLIAATNIDLDKAVKEGRFREDLFYRLNVVPIKMPALRDRIEDLPDLARFFLRRYNVKFRRNIQGIAESTMQILCSYWWPGNIRELENLIERLVAVSDKEWITDEDLPYELHVAQHRRATARPRATCWKKRCSTFERNFIIRALEKSGWNVTATARALGIPLSTLKFKIEKLEIQRARRGKSAETEGPAAAYARCATAGQEAGHYIVKKENPAHPIAPGQTRKGGTALRYFFGSTASLSCLAIRALTTVFAGILICLSGRRVAAHARLPLLHHELHHPGQHELTRALQLFL